MLSVSRETKRDAYIALLLKWNSAINLTSAGRASASALQALVDDCLSIVPHLPEGLDRLIDLGSGQGFPAIPIAIETGIAIDLVEADRRKAAFLNTAMATLQLAGTVYATRFEVATVPPARCITARALAPVAALVKMARPFLEPNGCCLFLKGPAALDEIDKTRRDGTFAIELLPTTRPPSTLVKVTLVE